MILINNYLRVINNYVGFSGRATRSEFWWWTLANFIVALVASILDIAIAYAGIPPFLYTVYALAVLCPNLAVAFRRLHDTNRSAWWLLISLIPLVGAIVLIVFFCQKGTAGKNNFGEPAQPAK